MAEKEKTPEQIEKEKELKIFWVRAILWSVFACFIPVAFIGWRYDLFKKVGSLQLSGWGLIAIVIIFVFLYVVVKYIRAGFTEWSMTKQIVNGVVKVLLPLGAVLAVAIAVRNNLDVFIQALSCVLMSEVIAIPINPFPEWVWKKTKGRFGSAVDYMVDRFYNRGSNDSKSKGE